MQLPGLAVGAPPAVVIDPVGAVGVLLDLTDQDARPDGVDGAGLDEEHIPRAHLHLVEHLQHRVVLNALLELLLAHRAVHAKVEKRPGLTVHDDPHLRLAVLPLHPQGVLVAGVHLDGKRVLGVDELDEHREVPEGPGVFPQDFRELLKILAQSQARMVPARQGALPGGVGGELPALRHLVKIAVFAVHIPQLGAAPQVVLERRRKLFQLHRGLLLIFGTIWLQRCHRGYNTVPRQILPFMVYYFWEKRKPFSFLKRRGFL